MSVAMYKSKVDRISNEIIRLRSEQDRQQKKSNDAQKKRLNAESSMTRTKSINTIKTKAREVERERKKQIDADKKFNDLSSKITKKEKELNATKKNLENAVAKERQNFERNTREDISELNINQHIIKNEINRLKSPKEKITILFIASDSLNPEQSKLNLDKEAREISDAIIKTKERDYIAFETKWATKVSDLFRIINETNPTIIHFSGHGTQDDELIFLDNNDNLKSVGMETIVKMINASCDDTRLIVFNNCFSANIAGNIAENIEAAIGMNAAIGDEAAIAFATQLYSSIGSGISLEKAFKQAVIQLELLDIPESETPELHVNSSFSAGDIVYVKKKESSEL